jgi:hypothetical protein
VPDTSYPFNDTARALEQLGWLKSQLDHCATKEDLREAQHDIIITIRDMMDKREAMAREEAERTQMRYKEDLNEAFRAAVPGTEKLVEVKMKDILAQNEEDFQKKLERSGYIENADGSIAPKVHIVRRLAVRYSNYLFFGATIAAFANPDKAWTVARWAMQAAF